jgi:DNA (cytosine-5)-methyltransferase 1
MRCVAQVENDPYCVRVLAKHWPGVPRWGDIRDLDPKELPDHDLICGGFPCQPVSLAGARQAQDDPRWLWPEMFRVVRTVRPRWVLVENVPGLASAGLGDVLGDLATVGYDAEWESVSACVTGAPHTRKRLFIVAYPTGIGRTGRRLAWPATAPPEPTGQDTGRGWPRSAQPRPAGVAYGVPHRVDRLRGLGNAVVPQVAELVGRMIRTAEGAAR